MYTHQPCLPTSVGISRSGAPGVWRRAAALRYELWNKWKGVDLEFVSVEDLGLPHDRAHFHSSSGGPALARVFGAIEIPPGAWRSISAAARAGQCAR
jgi:hypothetical protein